MDFVCLTRVNFDIEQKRGVVHSDRPWLKTIVGFRSIISLCGEMRLILAATDSCKTSSIMN